MDRSNLRLLAGWLLDNHQRLVEDNAFNMRSFRRNVGSVCDFVSKDDCGTVGCALGWAPVSGISSLDTSPKDFTKTSVTFPYHKGTTSLDFDKYCTRVFGISHDCGEQSVYWAWCFDEDWGHLDNTPRGAAIRILYLLSHKEEVVEWGDVGVDYDEDVIAKYMSWWDMGGGKKGW